MTIDLRELFLAQQSQLESKLQAGRKVIRHPSAKGDAAEWDWTEMLNDYLPSRYQATKAFVLDIGGALSDQIDIVIHDRQYSPLLFSHGGATYVPAESVYAVLEVKQELSKETVDYAGSKAASVRRLHRTSVEIAHAGGTYAPKVPFRILAGILTLDSSWTPPLGPSLVAALGVLDHESQVDLGCVLRHGSFEATYRAASSTSTDAAHDFSRSDSALIFFVLRLLDRLQGLGTVPALDLKQYMAGLYSKDTADAIRRPHDHHHR